MKKILTHYKGPLFEQLQSVLDVATFLGVPVRQLKYLTATRARQYFSDEEQKHDGTFRQIQKPSKELKKVQTLILKKIVARIPLADCVYGLHKGRGIVENALLHNEQPYAAKFDIRHFFPSIHISAIKNIYLGIGCGEEAARTLTALATNQHQLPQGAPTSSYLASVVLHDVDFQISQLAQHNNFTYSRYCDDICVSGNQDMRLISRKIREVICSHGFTLSAAKTKYFGPSDEKIVTGITIRNGKLHVPVQTQLVEDHVKMLRRGEVDLIESRIRGLIAFIRQVDPNLSKRLLMDYEQKRFQKKQR